jgi:uncharacterized protein (TIGR03437 family)
MTLIKSVVVSVLVLTGASQGQNYISGRSLSPGAAMAQQYIISTYAGGAPTPTPAPAASVNLDYIGGMSIDADGNIYFRSGSSLFKLDRTSTLNRIAGNGRPGYSGDGGPAINAQLLSINPQFSPTGIAVDAVGNIYSGDGGLPGPGGSASGRIRRIAPNGIITTVAGVGSGSFSGDGGPAVAAGFTPSGVAVDAAGNLFIADIGAGRIRKVTPDGIITTIAGNGTCCDPGDGGPATSAAIPYPSAITLDSNGNLFVASMLNIQRVRKISPDGIITTVAGGGSDPIANGVPANSASLSRPLGLATDNVGNLYIADLSRVRKVAPDGTITTVAGNGLGPSGGDGGPAIAAQFSYANGVVVDSDGNLFISDSQHIREVSVNGVITTIAGNPDPPPNGDGGSGCCFSGDGGPAIQAQLNGPTDVALDAVGNLFVADGGNNRVRKISPDGTIATAAGNGAYCSPPNACPSPGDGGPATQAELIGPEGAAVDKSNNLLIADVWESVRKVTPDGIITTVAPGVTGGRVTSDAAGDVFVSQDTKILKIAPDGSVATVAGNGWWGFAGDGGPATAAEIDIAETGGCDPGIGGGMAFDPAGDLVFADTDNNRVRQISPNGIISTIAAGSPLEGPSSVAFDNAGNLLIADFWGNRVFRRAADGTITTVAGNGGSGYSGDGGPAGNASLAIPSGVAVDSLGNIYVADTGNNAIRVLRPANQSVIIGAVVDAASQRAGAVSPGKIVVIYGNGLGPAQLVQNQPAAGRFGTETGGTAVYFNGIAAPILYSSAAQVGAIVPYAVSGTIAQVTVAYQGETSDAFSVQVAPAAPSLFTANETGAGQAAAVNDDGTINSATNPAKIGSYISLYATGEGQTSPAGVDGQVSSAQVQPLLPVSVSVGGVPAIVQYAGSSIGQVAGLMQVNVQIPSGVQPGGYVPAVLQVGDVSTTPGAVWIAVSGP